MTVVKFRRSVPLADDSTMPAEGYFRFTLSKRRIIPGAPDNVITPKPFTVDIVDGIAAVMLAPSAPGWAWHVLESVDGVPDIRYWIVVPDSAEPVDDTDLPRIDPSTLEPTAAPEAAWWGVANSTITAAAVVGDDLVVTRHDGTQTVAGRVTPTPEYLAGKVGEAVDPAVESAVGTAVPPAVDAAVGASLPASVAAAVGPAVTAAVAPAVTAAIGPAAEAAVQAATPVGAAWIYIDTDGIPYFKP